MTLAPYVSLQTNCQIRDLLVPFDVLGIVSKQGPPPMVPNVPRQTAVASRRYRTDFQLFRRRAMERLPAPSFFRGPPCFCVFCTRRFRGGTFWRKHFSFSQPLFQQRLSSLPAVFMAGVRLSALLRLWAEAPCCRLLGACGRRPPPQSIKTKAFAS